MLRAMLRFALVVPFAAVACASAGCSATKDSSGTNLVNDAGGGPHDDGFVLPDDSGFSADTPAGEVTTASDCAEENKDIYVVTESEELYRFAPATLTFTKVGTLSCPSDFATPFSMAVDRKGTAWVLYNDGKLYRVSTKDASCTATSFATGQHGFDTFGMAFVSDSPGSTTETLYVADYAATGLGKVDTTSLKLDFVGPYGSGGGAGELTGRGDARLFAFFEGSPTRVAELDKSTGKIMSMKNVTGLTVGSGWAFAHWGGSYWLFTAPSGSSQVTEFDFDTGTSKTVKSGLGFVIVGAGVSTCAPTERPK